MHHIDLQPDVRPRSLSQTLELLDGWSRLAEQVDFPVYIETLACHAAASVEDAIDGGFTDAGCLGDVRHAGFAARVGRHR